MPPSSFFDRLGRAISAGIREFQNQNTATKDVPPSNDMKSWDRGSRIRAQEARDKKHPIPLEGIEGRDKWLRENLPRDVAERVITVLGSNPEDDFNSIDALMSISSRFVGEERKFDYKPTEAQYKGNYFTRLEEKFVMKLLLQDYDFKDIQGFINTFAARMTQLSCNVSLLEMTKKEVELYGGDSLYTSALIVMIRVEKERRQIATKNTSRLHYLEKVEVERVEVLRAKVKRPYNWFSCALIFFSSELGIATMAAGLYPLDETKLWFLWLFIAPLFLCAIHFGEYYYSDRFEIIEILSDSYEVAKFREKQNRV
ncbi:hypothetical protein HYFRA_00002549 [Hymenoscyphus fraxineus]|uniref:Uncharacterized protein n=1 Tax=Hymenoscyphus fraxineus TaxID=746836 RepID=A0A9N9PNM3_9HELO|nr:hypothetical protein HYFRA_00002549 [Hymenoscyphus fraxineus]